MSNHRVRILGLSGFILFFSIRMGHAATGVLDVDEKASRMKIWSSAFEYAQTIPTIHTCDDLDYSPPLVWSNAPANTRSFALIVFDPDAPSGVWVHWLLYNIPPEANSLPQHVSPEIMKQTGILEGMTSFGKPGYGGPCPPNGNHRYLFNLYALDEKLTLPAGASKTEFLNAIEGHVLAEARWMGKYERLSGSDSGGSDWHSTEDEDEI